MTQTATDETCNDVGEGNDSTATSFRRLIPVAMTVGVSFGIVALQLVQGVLLARLLGPEGRGEYATAVLYGQTLLYIGLFGAIEVVCRHAANPRIKRESLRRTAVRLSMLTSSLTIILVMLLSTFALPDDKRYLWPLAIVCAFSILGQQVMLIVSAVDRGRGDFTRFNRLRMFAAAIFPALLLCWAMVAQPTITSTCWLLVIATLVSMVPCLIPAKPSEGTEEAPPATQLLREGRPYAISMLATDILDRIDLLLILWLTSIVTQGYYTAMIPVAYPLTVIPNTLGLFLFNAGAKEGGGLDSKKVTQILASSLAIQTVMTIGFLLLVDPVVRFVYGEEFGPAVSFAMWLAPIAAVKGIVQGLESYVKGRGNPLATIHIRLVSAMAMLVSIAMLYSFTGAYAILQGALVGQIVCLLGLVALVYRDVRGEVCELFPAGGSQMHDPE